MADQHDFSLKYDGKVLVLHIVMNTDQDPNRLMDRIKRLARGPRLDALVAWIEGYDGDAGRQVWDEVQKIAVQAHADPKAKPW
jgi:hypothetical protein